MATIAVSDDLLDRSLSSLHRSLRERTFSSRDLLAAAQARHVALGPTLNAYRLWSADLATAAAETADQAFAQGRDLGLLQGLPFAVKDIFGLAGTDTFGGTPSGWPAKWCEEGALVASMRAQGGVPVGKVHTVEFAFGVIGTNAHWGTPRNPWNAEVAYVPGGSTSGAGVAVSEGSALVVLGSDAGGSIRVPASLSGTVGFRTSTDVWPSDGKPPFCPTQDSSGTITRTVEDAAFAFAALGHAEDLDWILKCALAIAGSGLRIAIPTDTLWEDVDQPIREAVREALREVEGRGARLVDLALPETQYVYEISKRGGLAVPEGLKLIEQEFADWIPGMDQNVWQRLDTRGRIDQDEWASRTNMFEAMRFSARQRLEAVADVIVTPTTIMEAPSLAEVQSLDGYRQANERLGRNCYPFNIWNMCALTLPVGRDRAGIPIGLQLAAPAGRERHLLAAALWIERVIGTARERLGRPDMIKTILA